MLLNDDILQSDGSDFSYRMLIDIRYKKAAQSRRLLSKLINAQGAYVLASGVLSAALLARPVTDPVSDEGAEGLPWWQTYTTATAHIQSLTLLEALPLCMLLISALSSLIGMFAVQGSKPEPLRVVVLLAGAAACIAVWPLFSGTSISAALSEYGTWQVSGDFRWFFAVAIQGLLDFFGFCCNASVAVVAFSLATALDSRKKQR